ncbi:TraV family lipoprotein [Salinisphaera sp. P385]|uniref:TraV family lipoprotein n=1 Tax=Spectribacter acetivorans TaxID=3075603 RepID=A0ABU3B7Y5_9GAMM|nr:TraV family lipoprotein [Salinisphaera sp. P385]MDT0618576.1 TraV family lipoprotein [Salinisphaera sp. P385]
MNRLFVLSFIPLLGACAIGNSDFACSGVPEGKTCMSALEVYDATNGVHQSPHAGGGHAHHDGHAPSDTTSTGRSLTPAPLVLSRGGISPSPDRPVPIRTEPKTLRILIGPWQDQDRDLNAGGYVFTDLAPRTWNIGAGPEAATGPVYPVQVGDSSTSGGSSADTDQPASAPTASSGGNSPNVGRAYFDSDRQ